MEGCPCSIFDVREEQILESNGMLRVQLICNMCGTLLDHKVVQQAGTEKAKVKVRSHDSTSSGDSVARAQV